MYKSKCSLKSDTFKEYVEFCYGKFGNDAKELINRFIGGLGTKYTKSFKGYMTTSIDDVIATWVENKDSKMIINREGDAYMIKLRNESLKIKNDTSIWRHVIDAGVVKMIEGMFELGGKIAGLSTDCITVSECGTTKKKKEDIKEDNVLNHMGGLFMEENCKIPDSRYIRERYTFPRVGGERAE